MLRSPSVALALLQVALLVGSCTKDAPATTPPIGLASERIEDADAVVQVEVGYRALPEREVEIEVALAAVGIVEMDKLVADITVEGFVLVAGAPEWTGFVAPRFPITHRASFRLLDDATSGTLTVRVQRSIDSTVLYEAKLPFVAEGDRAVPEA